MKKPCLFAKDLNIKLLGGIWAYIISQSKIYPLSRQFLPEPTEKDAIY